MKTKPQKSSGLTKVIPAVRVSDEDYQFFLSKVEASGLTPSEYHRECVLNDKTIIVAKEKRSLEKQRMLMLFNQMQNDLQTIARWIYHQSNTEALDHDTCTTALTNLNALSRYLKAALNHVD